MNFSSDSDEDNVLESDESSKIDDIELTEKRPCCCCLTAQRFYHLAYIALFMAYLVIFPLWAKWLICAPMPIMFWNDDLKPFPLLPLREMQPSGSDVEKPTIRISEIPANGMACNFSCGEEYLGYRSNLMNFEVTLSLNQASLAKRNVFTAYPVLLASEDFENWQLVADRRHAQPEPFFRSRSESTGQVYVQTTRPCMSMDNADAGLTSSGIYIVGCATWHSASMEALDKLETVTTDDLNRYCNSVGGVCGWPCSSSIPPTRLTGCSAEGVIQNESLAEWMPEAITGGRVEVFSCMTPAEGDEDCALSTQRMSLWPCHQCHKRLPEGSVGGEGDDRRRLQDPEDEDELVVNKRYLSLPQMQVKMYDSKVPGGTDLFNAPRSIVFASTSLNGTWKRLYSGKAIDTVPIGSEIPKDKIRSEGDMQIAMHVEHTNSLYLNSESCFGKRGPLYLVACAVNGSIYDDASGWRGKTQRFSPGQQVAPPPFNDRCVAVAGRCGHACTTNPVGQLPFCQPDGYIEQDVLVGQVRMQYNRLRVVLVFICVLLCGFAVKVLMLCPGIFSPYKHAHDYSPDMTESFRYIVVCSPVVGADENKGTMLRNIIGTVSCMPPECRCRYHVVVNDEGHRNEMKKCWKLFCNIIDAVPNFGDDTYEKNVLAFTHVWCIETKPLTLPLIGGKVNELDDKTLDKLCGKTALQKLLKESRWRTWDRSNLTGLEAALEALKDDLKNDYNRFTIFTPYLDNIGDWEPKDPSSVALRMHYTSRAKPVEDTRNIMVQHVAVGNWYYRVPKGSSTEDWLQLRTQTKEMVYALPDDDDDCYQVPLRSSHGKAGGLNFVDNYMALVSRRYQNKYMDERDEAPSLYAIADARHQFQPDFMLSCIPYFFTRKYNVLNDRVAFTQAPQHYPEYSDSSDYMDYNNAAFFRLNAMIRNCCGGVTSCGTNGMWLIPPRDDDGTIWQKRRKRVRDYDGSRRDQLIEREQFHTSCKIEDTASSLDQVLVGRHSHFVNRKLSFGMAKAPTDFIGAQQRWVEGAVTLALQWFSGNADSHSESARNGWMLWATVLIFATFMGALLRLVMSRSDTSVFVKYGVLSRETFDTYTVGMRELIWFQIGQHHEFLKLLGLNEVDVYVYAELFNQFVIWSATTVAAFSVVVFLTIFAKFFSRCCGVSFPNEMRWWARLIISMDNLTYFVWFWTSFFWVGFNYYTALFEMHFHFNNEGMMLFMLVINLLNWGLIITNSCRYSVMESIDANEVAALSMDNVWRSNQLFFMTGPIQLFSVVRGISEFIKYKFYGQDIGGWAGGDLGKISVSIVKYWTTFLLLACVGCWVCYGVYAHEYANSFSACIVVTMISLDVLHPCVFLWLGNVSISPDQLKAMTCCQCLMSLQWWQVTFKGLILNTALTGLLKFLAPAYFLLLPILALASSYFGLTGAYMLIAQGPGH
mmetsp:Transcript_38162/g.106258  ORF Transcript_38162/g.106258 Transcript_38162/m.106258 type:complete len:1435 (-) Transcript_38162:178-4482(-)